jgi:hypothetical protein
MFFHGEQTGRQKEETGGMTGAVNGEEQKKGRE